MIAADLQRVSVWVATTPIDMRKSFDGLAEVVRSFLGRDPLSGNLFVFRNKGGRLLKILWWDQNGLSIYYRRLERTRRSFNSRAAMPRPSRSRRRNCCGCCRGWRSPRSTPVDRRDSARCVILARRGNGLFANSFAACETFFARRGYKEAMSMDASHSRSRHAAGRSSEFSSD